MAFLNSLDIGGSALMAQKTRMNIISQNIANADTTRTAEGGPYIRKVVTLRENIASFQNVLSNESRRYSTSGVLVDSISDDTSALKSVYNPSHPDADENGYVMLPNVDTTQEMVDMISATRSYEANVTAFNAIKLMASKALEIGR